MKIKRLRISFERWGFANNSSSTHSLIFPDQKIKNDCDVYQNHFGWNTFICATKEAKVSYAAHILKHSFLNNLNSDSDLDLDFRFLFVNAQNRDKKEYSVLQDKTAQFKEKIYDLKREFFFDFIDFFFPWMKLRDNHIFRYEGYIDHQSLISLPHRRTNEDCVDLEFADAFLRYFVDNDFYVFGGNDNSDVVNPPFPNKENLSQDIQNFMTVWNALKRDHYLCFKDPLTSEFVLSTKGHLLKISFQ